MTPELDQVFDEVRGAWRFRCIAVALAFVVALDRMGSGIRASGPL